ncbi:hypothetical protein IC582_003870 [Cucumis melo]
MEISSVCLSNKKSKPKSKDLTHLCTMQEFKREFQLNHGNLRKSAMNRKVIESKKKNQKRKRDKKKDREIRNTTRQDKTTTPSMSLEFGSGGHDIRTHVRMPGLLDCNSDIW